MPISGPAFTIFELEIFATDGKTFFTTGAKLLLLGPWLASATFTVAGGFDPALCVVCATPKPAAPSSTPKASAAGFEK
jgi:hypothetical protein